MDLQYGRELAELIDGGALQSTFQGAQVGSAGNQRKVFLGKRPRSANRAQRLAEACSS